MLPTRFPCNLSKEMRLLELSSSRQISLALHCTHTMSECCVIGGVVSGGAQPPEVGSSPPNPLWNLGRHQNLQNAFPPTWEDLLKPIEAGDCDHTKNAFALAELIQLHQFRSPWWSPPESS